MDQDDSDQGSTKVDTGAGAQTIAEPSLSGLQQQHQQQKNGLEAMLKGLHHESGTPAPSKELERNDKKVQESGIKLDAVPEFLRPAYIKVINLIQSPTTRLEKNKVSVEDLITQLESVEEEITKALYGPNYNGISGKLGGLHKEYQTLADERYKTAKVIDNLGKEISATYLRVKKTETALGGEANPVKIKEINDHLIGYRFDLERYEGIKLDLEGNIEGHQRAVKGLSRDIDVATHFHNYVRGISQKARNSLKVYRSTKSQVGYTELVSQLIPALQKRLGDYIGMIGDFSEKSKAEMGYVVGVTQQSFEIPAPDDDGISPFQGMQVADEKRSEEVSRQVQEILKNPYGDIYKIVA